jgi:hypothetical protein
MLSALTATLALLLAGSPGAGASVLPLSAGLNTDSMNEFTQTNAQNGTLASTGDSYAGGAAVRATYSGGGGNGYARGIFNVAWREGDDVWYRAAFKLPLGFKDSMQGQVALMRWDDWESHPDDTNQSGVVIYGGDKRSRLILDRLGPHTQTELTGDFDLPEGRWFLLEVHQRLSTSNAVNEVYLDGVKVASGSVANLDPGRGVDRIRYGVVAIAAGAQNNPLSLQFDEAHVDTQGPTAPRPGTVPPAAGTPTPQGTRTSTAFRPTATTTATATPATVRTTTTQAKPAAKKKVSRLRKATKRAIARLARRKAAKRHRKKGPRARFALVTKKQRHAGRRASR